MSGFFEPKIVVKSSLRQTIDSMRKYNIALPDKPDADISVNNDEVMNNGKVTKIEANDKYKVDVKNGESLSKRNGLSIAAYDESIIRYSMLAGKAYFTSHALVLVRPDDYTALTMLTANFYSKSTDVCESMGVEPIENEGRAYKVDKTIDELEITTEYTPENSVLLIDGPLIGGDAYTHIISSESKYSEKNIMPVFFVKNSNSNLVTNFGLIDSSKYNSDMHWADSVLKQGERTSFFKYVDAINEKNTKVFCYLKFFNGSSPVRVEFYTNMFFEKIRSIDEIMSLVLYLIYCQGDLKNPQVRPIAIAEMYARETLKLIDVRKIMKDAGLTPTMNEVRGMERYDEVDSTG